MEKHCLGDVSGQQANWKAPVPVPFVLHPSSTPYGKSLAGSQLARQKCNPPSATFSITKESSLTRVRLELRDKSLIKRMTNNYYVISVAKPHHFLVESYTLYDKGDAWVS